MAGSTKPWRRRNGRAGSGHEVFCAALGGFWGYPRGHGIGNSGKDGEIYNEATGGARRAMWRVIYGMYWK